jgi:hypothetical protein
VSARAGNGTADVSWQAPASDGGSAITGYVVTASPGGRSATVGGGAASATVNGLSNGTTYTFTVKARNAVGTGTASVASNGVTPVGPPGAPTGVSASGGNGLATVSFQAPASNGGAPISGYTVIASPGGATAGGGGSPITIGGLANGTGYTFTVTAMNSAGTGPQSGASNSVTPQPPPAPIPPPTPAPTAPPPSVSVSKGGSAQGQSGCSSSACRYVQISWANFGSGATVSVQCWSDVDSIPFYSFTKASNGAGAGSDARCYFGFPGRNVWAVVNGVQSNRVVW